MNHDDFAVEPYALPPISPFQALCNREVLNAATRDYDRRHARTSRRASARVQPAAPPEPAISRETAA